MSLYTGRGGATDGAAHPVNWGAINVHGRQNRLWWSAHAACHICDREQLTTKVRGQAIDTGT